tara:strand:- start:86 stop:229 length:144 start_codon:yes stop_codon:yes gene_type:complete
LHPEQAGKRNYWINHSSSLVVVVVVVVDLGEELLQEVGLEELLDPVE